MSGGNVREHKSGSRASILMFFLLLLVIGVIAFFVYIKSSDIDIHNINLKDLAVSVLNSEEKTPSERNILELLYEERNDTVFSTYRGLIIKCTKDDIVAINKSGEEIWSKSISLSNPIIKTNGSEMLVADIGGRSVHVFKGKNIKWEGKADSAIVNVDISAGGYVTLVQEVEGYRNKIKAYDPYGIEMLYTNIADNYVLDAKISPSGEQLMINSINASGISVKSKLEFLRVLEESPFAAVIKEEMVFPSIWFLDNDSMLAVSDSHLAFFDEDKSEVWNKSINMVYSSNVCLGKYMVIAAADIAEESYKNKDRVMVEVLNTRGQQVAHYPVDDKVKNIRTYSDVIAVNTGREIHFINTRGKLRYRMSSKADILDVHFINKIEAVIITKNSVRVINIGK